MWAVRLWFGREWNQAYHSFLLVFWTPGWWEGSSEFSSVCLYVCRFVCTTFFLESTRYYFLVENRKLNVPGGSKVTEHIFLGKFKFWEKSVKGQKWPQNRVFGLLKKMKSLVLWSKMNLLVVLFCGSYGFAKITLW